MMNTGDEQPATTWVSTVEGLASIHVHGDDATTFLQGQLSNDVAALEVPGAGQLSSLSTARGRVFAVVLLLRRHDGGFTLVVPTEQAADLHDRLRMFVLRARVTLALDTANAPIGVAGADLLARVGLQAGAGAWSGIAAPDGSIAVRWFGDPPRALLLGSPPAAPAGAAQAPESRWWDLEVAAGIPWLRTAAVREQFVAQMLNLDHLGALSFDKGCYTGQEVIARAHYRGRVKRHLHRFAVAAGTESPVPGTAVEADAGGDAWSEAGTVVNVASDGSFLAVVQADAVERPLRLAGGTATLRALALPSAG